MFTYDFVVDWYTRTSTGDIGQTGRYRFVASFGSKQNINSLRAWAVGQIDTELMAVAVQSPGKAPSSGEKVYISGAQLLAEEEPGV